MRWSNNFLTMLTQKLYVLYSLIGMSLEGNGNIRGNKVVEASIIEVINEIKDRKHPYDSAAYF